MIIIAAETVLLIYAATATVLLVLAGAWWVGIWKL